MHGWVYSSPTAFGLARIVGSAWPECDLQDPRVHALPEEGDAWYFMRVAGNAAEVFARLPFPMPMVIYRREKTGKSIRMPYDRFARLLLPSPPECGFHAIERGRKAQDPAPAAADPARTPAGVRRGE